MMLRILTIAVTMLLTTSAMAQTVYRWVDDRGEIHYGHAVPPEYAQRGFDRMGPDGQVRERIAPALTPEERAARDVRMALDAERQAEQRSQDTRDRLLLASYSSEEDISNALNVQLTALNSQRGAIRASLRQASSRFENLVGRAAQLTREGQIVPSALNDSIDETRQDMRRLREALADIDEREAIIRQRFGDELVRFIQLTGPSGS